MSTGRRILVNGLLAAVPSALIGLMLASLAGLYLDSQTPTRPGVPRPADSLGELHVRLPAVMAVFGFLFVAVGEGVMSLWRKPTATPPPIDFDKIAEAQIQAILANSAPGPTCSPATTSSPASAPR